MENIPQHRIVESFSVSPEKTVGGQVEYKLARFSNGDYGIFKVNLTPQSPDGNVLKISQDNIVAYGQEEGIKKTYESIKVGLLVRRDDEVLKKMGLKAVELKENEKIEATLVNIRPSNNNKTDLILKGDRTWVYRIPNHEAQNLNIGQQITLEKTQQGLKIREEKAQQLSQTKLQIN